MAALRKRDGMGIKEKERKTTTKHHDKVRLVR